MVGVLTFIPVEAPGYPYPGELEFTNKLYDAGISQNLAISDDLESPEYLESLARKTALKNDLNASIFVDVLKCESADWQNGQSMIPADGPNGREDSWGVAQIHLPSHPHITKEQALDPVWAMEWMSNEWKEGRAEKWTCYRKMNPGH